MQKASGKLAIIAFANWCPVYVSICAGCIFVDAPGKLLRICIESNLLATDLQDRSDKFIMRVMLGSYMKIIPVYLAGSLPVLLNAISHILLLPMHIRDIK